VEEGLKCKMVIAYCLTFPLAREENMPMKQSIERMTNVVLRLCKKGRKYAGVICTCPIKRAKASKVMPILSI